MKTVILWVGTLLFLVFMGLQFNDVQQFGNGDNWLWVVIYGVAACLSIPKVFDYLGLSVYGCLMGFFSGCLLFRLQDDQGNMQWDRLNPNNFWGDPDIVQQANESGGLFILACWALGLFWLKSRNS